MMAWLFGLFLVWTETGISGESSLGAFYRSPASNCAITAIENALKSRDREALPILRGQLVNLQFSDPTSEVRARFVGRFAEGYPARDRFAFANDSSGEIIWTDVETTQLIGESGDLKEIPAMEVRATIQKGKTCSANALANCLRQLELLTGKRKLGRLGDFTREGAIRDRIEQIRMRIYREGISLEEHNQETIRILEESGLRGTLAVEPKWKSLYEHLKNQGTALVDYYAKDTDGVHRVFAFGFVGRPRKLLRGEEAHHWLAVFDSRDFSIRLVDLNENPLREVILVDELFPVQMPKK